MGSIDGILAKFMSGHWGFFLAIIHPPASVGKAGLDAVQYKHCSSRLDLFLWLERSKAEWELLSHGCCQLASASLRAL